MNLDAMKERWAAQDHEIKAAVAMSPQLFRASALNPIRTALGRLKFLIVLNLAVSLTLAVALGWYNFEHLRELHFLAPGLVLHIGVVLMIIVSGLRLAGLVGVDLSAPVVEIQRALGKAEALAIRETFWVLAAAPLLWIPMLIVGLKGLFGIDVYAFVDLGWLAVNILFGLAVIVLALWASRRYADRLDGSPRLQGLAKILAGHNLAAAAGFLDEVSSFEEQGWGP